MLCRLSGLLTLCWFTVAAQALYAQNPVISLTLKNATVREVIEAVKTQSGYSFWYRESEIDLRKRVSVEAHDQNVLNCSTACSPTDGSYCRTYERTGHHSCLLTTDRRGGGTGTTRADGRPRRTDRPDVRRRSGRGTDGTWSVGTDRNRPEPERFRRYVNRTVNGNGT